MTHIQAWPGPMAPCLSGCSAVDQFDLVFELFHARRHGGVHSRRTSFIETFTSGVFGLSGVLLGLLKIRADYSDDDGATTQIV
jgi:hypothetical protein